MEPKTGVVISINRAERKGCIRVPQEGEFDHEFNLSEAPLRIKRDWRVSFLSIPGETPDRPIAIRVRSIPKPAA